MFYAITIIDDRPELQSFDSYQEAANFARDVAADGQNCEVVQLVRLFPAGLLPPAGELYGVSAGVHYPATL